MPSSQQDNKTFNHSNGVSQSQSQSQYNSQSLLSAIKTTSSMLEQSVGRAGEAGARTEGERLTWLERQQRRTKHHGGRS